MRLGRLPLLWLVLAACGPDPQVVELRVMTMNLRHDVDFWEDRFALIAAEIVRLAPDVIGFQEVEIAADQSRVLNGLIVERDPRLIYEYDEELKTQLAAVTGEGIGVFSRFPIVSRAIADLSYGRPALFTRLRVTDEVTIDFYNTHLHNEGGDEVRQPQMQAVLDFVRTNERGNLTFLTGDMNARPDSETYRTAVEAGLIDTFAAVHGDQTELIGNTSPIQLARMPVEQRPTQRIDYVFMAPPPPDAKLQILSSTVAFSRPDATGLYPSDHLGVMTTISIDLTSLTP